MVIISAPVLIVLSKTAWNTMAFHCVAMSERSATRGKGGRKQISKDRGMEELVSTNPVGLFCSPLCNRIHDDH